MEGSRPADAGQLEAELVASARSGSAAAFDELVDHYYPIILAYLLRQTGEREWARDLTQETFLDAFRSLDQLPGGRSFRAWLFVIARNNYRHALRRYRLRSFVSLDWLASSGRRLPAQGDSIQTYAERDAVQQALKELSPTLREPLVLLSLGYSLKEAADILNISHAAARKRAGRGLRQLHSILTDGQEGGDE